MKLFSRTPTPVEPIALADAPAPQKTRVAYDLTRLGDQMREGSIDQNVLHAWCWVFAANRGRPFTFNWSTDARVIWDGGPDKLTRGLQGLVDLGWVSVTEDGDRVVVHPTPGDAAIRC